MKQSGSLYVPRIQPKRGEFKRLYQTLEVSFDQGIHLGLTKTGLKDSEGVQVPVLKDDLGLEVPKWINRVSKQLFSKNSPSNGPNVVLKSGKMYLIDKTTYAYAVCASSSQGKTLRKNFFLNKILV